VISRPRTSQIPISAVGELGGDASLSSSACIMIAFSRLAPFHKTSTEFDRGNYLNFFTSLFPRFVPDLEIWYLNLKVSPTECFPFQVNRFHKSILLIVQYKYLKSCSEDFVLKNQTLRARSCCTAFITQHNWLLHFRQAEICLMEMICTAVVPASKGQLGGASP